MQNVAKFQEVVALPDEAMRAKIHTTFRLGYIKDAALPRALDDVTMAALHSMMMFNYMDILQARAPWPAFAACGTTPCRRHSSGCCEARATAGRGDPGCLY